MEFVSLSRMLSLLGDMGVSYSLHPYKMVLYTTPLYPHPPPSRKIFANKLNFFSGAEFGSEHPALKILPSGDQVGFT